MNDDKINLHQALNAFEKIRDLGEARDGGYYFNGLKASSDFDGYSIVISSRGATLTVNFHNTYYFDYTDADARKLFLKQLGHINQANEV